MNKISYYFPYGLLIFYLVFTTLLGLNPYDRATWWAENLPIFITVFLLVATFRKFRFSNFSYFLIWFFLCYHTIGGHFTFERVPFDFVSNLFGWERNNFDRIGHFLVGVFAYPAAELFFRKKWTNNIWASMAVGVFALGFWAALYEIIEAGYAIFYGGDSAVNFLGSQGDPWDAQKDMLLDILGALAISILFYFKNKNNPVTS